MARDPSLTGFFFTKQERLKNFQDFKRVYSGGKRLKTRNFIIYVLPNDLGWPRLGLAVSAKITNSPGRSRVKRLLREFFRLNKACFTDRASHGLPRNTPGCVGRNRYEASLKRPNPPYGIKIISKKEETQPITPTGRVMPTEDDGLGFKTGALDVVISLRNPVPAFGLKEIREELAGALLKTKNLC
jgi:ribonuclease P protein component